MADEFEDGFWNRATRREIADHHLSRFIGAQEQDHPAVIERKKREAKERLEAHDRHFGLNTTEGRVHRFTIMGYPLQAQAIERENIPT